MGVVPSSSCLYNCQLTPRHHGKEASSSGKTHFLADWMICSSEQPVCLLALLAREACAQMHASSLPCESMHAQWHAGLT